MTAFHGPRPPTVAAAARAPETEPDSDGVGDAALERRGISCSDACGFSRSGGCGVCVCVRERRRPKPMRNVALESSVCSCGRDGGGTNDVRRQVRTCEKVRPMSPRTGSNQGCFSSCRAAGRCAGSGRMHVRISSRSCGEATRDRPSGGVPRVTCLPSGAGGDGALRQRGPQRERAHALSSSRRRQDAQT